MEKSFENLTITNHGIDRRGFLKGMGATGVLLLTANWSWSQEQQKKYGGEGMPGGTKNDPKLFIAISQDGTVYITCTRSEMGQGIRTSLALVVADEMEADWEKCRVVQAEGDEEKYGNQNTDGSRSMRHWYEPMRQCGAVARAMLEQAASLGWGVDLEDVRATKHSVVFPRGRRRAGFGELAEAVARLPVPTGSAIRLALNEFRYIGKEQTLSADGKT